MHLTYHKEEAVTLLATQYVAVLLHVPCQVQEQGTVGTEHDVIGPILL